MEPTESRIPPGFRFHPTDEELVGYYLKKKVASQKLDLNVIKDVDLYRMEPWDIQERCRIGYEEQKEWYFFSHKDKKYPTGTRTNRATLAGFWKATGRDKAVYHKATLIGMRKTLVFYRGRAPNGHKSDWIMHEYRLQSDQDAPPQEEGWVVCRAFRKRTNVNYKASTDQGWDSFSSSFNLYDQETIPSSSSSSSSHSFLCKQEVDHKTTTMINNHNMTMMNNLNSILFTHPHQDMQPFLQLPRLHSPPLVLPLLSSDQANNNPLATEKVTDWRALDKFVASQLSHDNQAQGEYHDHNNDQGAGSSFDGHDNEHGLLEMALLLLQNSGKDEGDGFINGLLAESDLGILHI